MVTCQLCMKYVVTDSSFVHGNHYIRSRWFGSSCLCWQFLRHISDSSWHLQWRQRRWQWKPWKVRRPWPKELFWVSWPLLLRWRSQISPKSWTHWLRSAQKRWRSQASSFSLACVWSRLARRRDLGWDLWRSFPLKKGIFGSPLGADFPHIPKEIINNWPGNQSHPKDIWSKNSTSPVHDCFLDLNLRDLRSNASVQNSIKMWVNQSVTLPKTNSSHLSGVSWPQKETHLSIFFASGSYQRWYSDDVWARDEGQTAAGEDCREGISCFSIEESNLRPWILIGECWAPNASGTLGVWSTTSISAGSAWCTLRVLESLWRFLIITPLDTLRDLICEKKPVGPRSELMWWVAFTSASKNLKIWKFAITAYQ